MTVHASPHPQLERRVARLLDVGTWLASAVIAVGLCLPSGTRVVAVGIGLFVTLPGASVAVMLHGFLRRREYRIAMIAALVLAIMLMGLVVGMRTTGFAATGRTPRASNVAP